MLNLVVLAAGGLERRRQDGYPPFLAQIHGKTLLEHWVETASQLGARLHLVMNLGEPEKWGFSELAYLREHNVRLFEVGNTLGGATCTAVVALAGMDAEEEVVILNADEYLNVDFYILLQEFHRSKADAGTLVFRSIHPRYSYVTLDEYGKITRAAEKRQISSNATAGFYWFKTKQIFQIAAESQILKHASHDGQFFICPLFNELILMGRTTIAIRIKNDQFIPLKTTRHEATHEGDV